MQKNTLKYLLSLSPEEIDTLIETHKKEPHLRNLQKTLVREITIINSIQKKLCCCIGSF